jgi:hypothetical protein
MALTLLKPSIDELRQLIGSSESYEKEKSSFSLFSEGFPLGAIVEISGTGKTELVAQFLKEHPDFKIAWVEENISINPYALRQKGVKLNNLLFIEAKKELSWCLAQALNSGCFQAVVTGSSAIGSSVAVNNLNDKKFSEKDLRRFQLLSEKCKSHFFLLSEKPHNSWVPHLQLEVAKTKSQLEIAILRKRGHA